MIGLYSQTSFIIKTFIESVTKYPESYSETLTMVRNEQDSNLRPDKMVMKISLH